VLAASAATVVLVVGVNGLFWRPLVAWSERFRFEDTGGAERPSAVLGVLRRTRAPASSVAPWLRWVGWWIASPGPSAWVSTHCG
jgi:NitT/TauT family transport system permease protein